MSQERVSGQKKLQAGFLDLIKQSITEFHESDKELNLEDREITDSDICAICDAFDKNNNITKVNLRGNALTDDSVKRLAQCKHIIELNVEDNSIADMRPLWNSTSLEIIYPARPVPGFRPFPSCSIL